MQNLAEGANHGRSLLLPPANHQPGRGAGYKRFLQIQAVGRGLPGASLLHGTNFVPREGALAVLCNLERSAQGGIINTWCYTPPPATCLVWVVRPRQDTRQLFGRWSVCRPSYEPGCRSCRGTKACMQPPGPTLRQNSQQPPTTLVGGGWGFCLRECLAWPGFLPTYQGTFLWDATRRQPPGITQPSPDEDGCTYIRVPHARLLGHDQRLGIPGSRGYSRRGSRPIAATLGERG